MSAKRIVVDSTRRKGNVFKVRESDGRFTIYHVHVNWFTNSYRQIGETYTLKDAIALIKATVDGAVSNIRIRDW